MSAYGHYCRYHSVIDKVNDWAKEYEEQACLLRRDRGIKALLEWPLRRELASSRSSGRETLPPSSVWRVPELIRWCFFANASGPHARPTPLSCPSVYPEGGHRGGPGAREHPALIHPHWNNYPPVNPMWHYVLCQPLACSHCGTVKESSRSGPLTWPLSDFPHADDPLPFFTYNCFSGGVWMFRETFCEIYSFLRKVQSARAIQTLLLLQTVDNEIETTNKHEILFKGIVSLREQELVLTCLNLLQEPSLVIASIWNACPFISYDRYN
ncbi:rhodopsin-like [Penaeus monodon]|uniref:rhodopsin-like n=1 Tax=Penaeus monodon TaxID=6687 RepID=UPI0018A77BF5|nr:rhodopsin-like [Penaeus monodon]